MTIEIKIRDGVGSSNTVHVSEAGTISVGPRDFSTAVNCTATVIDSACPLVRPIAGMSFVVTSILFYADKSVGKNDATVVLYEADDDITITPTKIVLQTELPQKSSRDIVGLNLKITSGKFLNVKTNDNNIYTTVFGYYIKA